MTHDAIYDLDDYQIDAVNGAGFFIPLLYLGIKAGLASSAGTAAAIAIGAAIGTAAAAAGLASATID